ncbi:type II toxin-antitoxin system RelE/ParE family toxin [Neorhizobium galegae]|uniref:type II toxin-antitoxin system RelE/ParE family toxin n=1 Tax=Neorhizobium galegae TaxID=399 RepID=UPI002100A94C|nr:type II toxin-antitoxin system RelE/ParE family toxin [Neorhizobium galegae]MCQ1575056.1 type II toxin-antitoxin system RelE/ParE family toxin [Neorhizobium galegae]
MFTIRLAPVFRDWLRSLKDKRAVSRITVRMERAASGNLGDVKSVGDGVNEMRIPYGPGYRLYFIRRGEVVIVLLCGGDKSTQQSDIAQAKRLAKDWKDEG